MGDDLGPTLDDIVVYVLRMGGDLIARALVWGNEVGRVAMPRNELNEYDRRSEVSELAARAYDAAAAYVNARRGGRPDSASRPTSNADSLRERTDEPTPVITPERAAELVREGEEAARDYRERVLQRRTPAERGRCRICGGSCVEGCLNTPG